RFDTCVQLLMAAEMLNKTIKSLVQYAAIQHQVLAGLHGKGGWRGVGEGEGRETEVEVDVDVKVDVEVERLWAT
ncbi:hypothetical protein HK405_014611, partial [Cladochytrium tenue]